MEKEELVFLLTLLSEFYVRGTDPEIEKKAQLAKKAADKLKQMLGEVNGKADNG